MSHLGLRSSVTNGEDDRSRTSVSAEQQLAPALRDLDLVVPTATVWPRPTDMDHGTSLSGRTPC
jgi:hypothetical protein